MHNLAFIDGQNLYRNTTECGWKIDLARLRIYLSDKYDVSRAYYFLGAVDESNYGLYELIQTCGFILVFREHNQNMIGYKKGNVDTDIVFSVLTKIIDGVEFNKVVLVSGDGDYFKMVRYLIDHKKFAKLLAPNRHSTSSLYKPLTPKYVSYLDAPGLKQKIELKKH